MDRNIGAARLTFAYHGNPLLIDPQGRVFGLSQEPPRLREVASYDAPEDAPKVVLKLGLNAWRDGVR